MSKASRTAIDMIEKGESPVQSPVVDLPIQSAGIGDARPGVLNAMLAEGVRTELWNSKTEAWRLYAVARR